MENPLIGSDITMVNDQIQSINSNKRPIRFVEQITIKIIKSTQNGKFKNSRGKSANVANITDTTNLGKPKAIKVNK